jgi:hypothetical protein
VSHLGLLLGTAQNETLSRTTRAGDKVVIRSSVALRAPPPGITGSAKAGDNATPPVSHANPSATHGVRSGVDEPFVTNAGGAIDGLVSDHFGLF